MKLFHIALSLLLILISGSQARALDIQNIRIGTHPNKTRIVIDVSDIQDFRAFTLGDPNRIVVDLPTFTWQATASNITKSSGISAIRSGQLDEQISRIVFDTDKPAQLLSVFALPASQTKPNRIVLDFTSRANADFQASQGKVFGTLEADTASQSQPAIATPTPPTKKPVRKKIIVLDAGHGGQDPGAVRGKTYEKNITLDLAKRTKTALEKNGNYTVILTRSTDRFIKLYERVKIAKRHNADLFVSIHADAIAGKPHIRGASIYTLSEKASDAQTARLAARENKADLIAGVDLKHEDADVASILIDLVQRDTMNQSNFFAEKLVKTFKNSGIKMLENPHRSAGFAVLKAPDIPSILIEAGFISNKQDEKLLKTSSHKQKIANTLANGIDSYFTYLTSKQKI